MRMRKLERVGVVRNAAGPTWWLPAHTLSSSATVGTMTAQQEQGRSFFAFNAAGMVTLLFALIALPLANAATVAYGAVAAKPAASAVTATLNEPQLVIAGDRRLLLLGSGDLIAIAVSGQPDMGSSQYVGDDGTISMPLIGRLPVAGLSPVEASAALESAFKAGKFLVDPHVTLTVTQSRSQLVSVLGEVRTPARYPIEPSTSIFDLLALAGGVTDDSSDVIYIMRAGTNGEVSRLPVHLHGMGGTSGDALPTFKLHAGDSIFVPRAESYYIYGEVANPKKYRIDLNMTVIQAIATAGGLTPRGSERRVDIKRLSANGTYKTVHAKPGDPVLADDVIRVKESIF
jgi:polysaccharide export outer membrane protein